MFAMTTAMATEINETAAARRAEIAGHRRNGEGTWSHEEYVDPTYGEKYCLHCEEYLGKA